MRAAAEGQRLPPYEQIREVWLQAVQEEDAAAAGWCARLCESLRGAEAFAEAEGLAAFLAVAKGQSMREGAGAGSLMGALLAAVLADVSDFKVAVFETLAAAARWPSVRGQVAGSGVLGVVAATLLANRDGQCRHPPAVRALMARLCGLLAVDDPEVVRLGDARRAKEFATFRSQLITSGAVRAVAEMAGQASEQVAAAAAARAVAALAGEAGDSASRAALVESGAVAHLLSRLPPDDLAAATHPAGEATAVEGPAEGAEAGDEDELEADDEAVAGGDAALPPVLSALAVIAATEGEGSQALFDQLADPAALRRLRAVVAGLGASRGHRQVVERALACLTHVGRRNGTWPEADEALAADLSRLLFFGSDAAGALLEGLLEDRARAAKLGDLRPLRRALEARLGAGSAAAAKALAATRGCDQCGRASERPLLVCGGCRGAEYCSQPCQKEAWRAHKPACKGARG